MPKGRRRTAATITLMTILAVIVLFTYYYWTHRTEPLYTGDKLSEVRELVNKDLNLYYPETAREVTKLFATMLQTLYNHPEDKERKLLELKLRELYDSEFLASNPEAEYLKRLDIDLKDWKEHDRRITNYLLEYEDQGKEMDINGVKYGTQFISFTIQENTKSTQLWEVMLRQDSLGHWKILGWEIQSESQ